MHDCNICLSGNPIYSNVRCCFNCAHDPYACEVCHSCGTDCPGWKQLSNADRIRAMTDDQLSTLICSIGWRLSQQKECLEWLKQPVDDFIK